jgi:hypothetical protein
MALGFAMSVAGKSHFIRFSSPPTFSSTMSRTEGLMERNGNEDTVPYHRVGGLHAH